MYTHAHATLRYKASDMFLYIDTDAAYLVTNNSKSRVHGYFYLSNHPTYSTKPPLFNAAIHVECRLLRHIVSSAAESEMREKRSCNEIKVCFDDLLNIIKLRTN